MQSIQLRKGIPNNDHERRRRSRGESSSTGTTPVSFNTRRPHTTTYRPEIHAPQHCHVPTVTPTTPSKRMLHYAALIFACCLYLLVVGMQMNKHNSTSSGAAMMMNANSNKKDGGLKKVAKNLEWLFHLPSFSRRGTSDAPPLPSGCFAWQGIMSPQQVQKQLLTTTATNDDGRSTKSEPLPPSPPPSGLVVSLLLGDHLLPYICNFFPSQMAHFIAPQGLDVLFVIPKQQQQSSKLYTTTTTTTTNDTSSSSGRPITMRELQKCLNLYPLPETTITTTTQEEEDESEEEQGESFVYQEWLNLDGSTLTTWEHRMAGYDDDYRHDPPKPTTTRIFLAETELHFPSYMQTNLSSFLDVPIEPKSCRAPLSYIQGTRWYIYEFLHLAILQEYDYFVKIDSDIVFIKTIPINLLHDMTIRGSIFGHFAKYPNTINTPCADTLAQAVQEFSRRHQQGQKEFKTNNNNNAAASVTNHDGDDWKWNGKYCSGQNHPLLQLDSDRYYANFIIGSTSYFQSPGPLQLGKFLSDEWRDGFFRHRWGDQAYWHYALGLFSGPDFDDPNNAEGGLVADYSEFRCAPETNCWLSAQEGKRIPDAANQCKNRRGSFLHTKSWKRFANQWNRWNARREPLTRGTRPYKTTYVHDCSNSTRWNK